MNGVRLLRRTDLALAEARDDQNITSRSWRTRSLVAGLSVWRCLERASGTGAGAVSLGELRDEHPDTPGRDRVSGPFNNNVRETSCSRAKKIAEVSKSSVESRRMERLIREEIIGHRMRTGPGNRTTGIPKAVVYCNGSPDAPVGTGSPKQLLIKSCGNL